jgi:enoyl-CoA hydratase/carnithine racemase
MQCLAPDEGPHDGAMPDTVRIAHENAVTTLRIDRPLKKNALDGATYRGLADGLTAALADDAVRVIVIGGSDEVFTSGNDLGDFVKVSQGTGGLAAGTFLEALVEAKKPIVAAVSGWAVGIGTTMLLHCDFVYAAPSAKFRTPFVDLGLCPEAASTVLLPAAIGLRHAVEMLYLGTEVDAARAAAWGLVTEVVPDPMLRAQEVAAQLATKPPGALQKTKELLRKPLRAAMTEALVAERDAFLERLQSREAMEAVMAMISKRK